MITAEILAKVQVSAVIKEFREEENTRIAGGLKKQELIKPLHRLTGRYDRVKQEEDGGLVLVTDSDEEYPLATLSTGAREQVFLALRMGFLTKPLDRKLDLVYSTPLTTGGGEPRYAYCSTEAATPEPVTPAPFVTRAST